MSSVAKFLIVLGIAITIIGLLMLVFARFKIPFLGKLPGDITIRRENFVFYFPLASSLLISIIISAIIYLFTRR